MRAIEIHGGGGAEKLLPDSSPWHLRVKGSRWPSSSGSVSRIDLCVGGRDVVGASCPAGTGAGGGTTLGRSLDAGASTPPARPPPHRPTSAASPASSQPPRPSCSSRLNPPRRRAGLCPSTTDCRDAYGPGARVRRRGSPFPSSFGHRLRAIPAFSAHDTPLYRLRTAGKVPETCLA